MPKVDEVFAELLAEASRELAVRGIRVRWTDGYRSIAAQQKVLRAKGRFDQGGAAALPGKSFHNYGLAADAQISPERWDIFGQVVESLGLRWGGRFTPTREPWHVDLGTVFNINEARQFFDRAYLVEVA